MQARTSPKPLTMMLWSDHPRLMTVIHGIPMYRSTGINSKHKNTWLPQLGVDGTYWIRKPHSELPEKIMQVCMRLELDKIISLSRLGTLQSLCISASLGDGFWTIPAAIELTDFLKQNYSHCFLLEHEVAHVHKLQNAPHHTKAKDIKTINTFLAKSGSWIPLDHQCRLPAENEYLFFQETKNSKIRAALSMMLVNKKCITFLTFKMVCKLSANETLLNYALNAGLFELHKNNNALIKRLITDNQSITLDDLIQMNPLHNIAVPLKYKNFPAKYTCRKILRTLPTFPFTELDFDIMKKMDDLNLLDLYADLFIDNKSRLVLFILHESNLLNCNFVKILWKIHTKASLEQCVITPLELDSICESVKSHGNLLKVSGLFAIEKKPVTSNESLPHDVKKFKGP